MKSVLAAVFCLGFSGAAYACQFDTDCNVGSPMHEGVRFPLWGLHGRAGAGKRK